MCGLPPGERPFPCTLCEKAFNQKSALQVHVKKHTGERPYRCEHCAMGFTQKSNMKLHVKRAHSYAGERAAGVPSSQHPASPSGALWVARSQEEGVVSSTRLRTAGAVPRGRAGGA